MFHDLRSRLAGMVLLLIGLSLLVGWALSAPVSADPGIRYAKSGGLTTGTCDSWSNACTWQRALTVAVSGDEIWVMKGVHYPGTTRDASFNLKKGVAIYGGFGGWETSRSQRNWQTHLTVLSGDIDKNDTTDSNKVVTTTTHITGNNSYHVLSTSGFTSSAILDGFVITAGSADATAGTQSWGGGMYNTNSSPTLRNLIFSGNKATEYGGGMYNSSSSPAMTNVTFYGNKADFGGGMYNYQNSNPKLKNITFRDNTADRGGGMYNWNSSPALKDITFSDNRAVYGGGMCNDKSSPTLTNVTFSGNNATQQGGGMYNDDSGPTLTNTTFNDNGANYGGGMYNQQSSPTLTNTIFSSNDAYSGGGMGNHSSNPKLTNVAFRGNTASGSSGGGMYNSSSSPTLTNTLFFSNTAKNFGGGMYTYGGNPKLTNVTFGYNKATQDGGGMYNDSSNPTLTNAIIWGNMAPTFPNLRNAGSSNPHIAYSDIGYCGGSGSWNGICGTNGGNNIDDNPDFVNLTGGDLHLQFGSHCIDAGNNAAVIGVATDLDGHPRKVDGNLNGIATVDMGAYEFVFGIYLPIIRK